MKPVIIKSDKVLEALFKGDEVIYITFKPNGRVDANKLTTYSIHSIKDVIENCVGSEIFMRLTEEPVEEEHPTGGEEETPTPEEPLPEENPENNEVMEE